MRSRQSVNCAIVGLCAFDWQGRQGGMGQLPRRWAGHPEGESAKHFRSVLYNEAARARDGTWLEHLQVRNEGTQRHGGSSEFLGRWGPVYRDAACGGSKLKVETLTTGDTETQGFRLEALYCHCYCIAAAETQRGNPSFHVSPYHFVNQRDQDSCATGANGMADCNRTAIHVDPLRIQFQFAHDSQRLHRKSLIQFVEINVFILPSRLLPDLPDRANWSHHDPLGLDAACRLSHDANHWPS